MSAERWVKDNGLLPGGFDQNRADERVRVHGSAESDASFNAGGDGVRFRVGVSPSAGPFTVTAAVPIRATRAGGSARTKTRAA